MNGDDETPIPWAHVTQKWHTEFRLAHPSLSSTREIVCPIHGVPCVQVKPSLAGYHAFECPTCTKLREAAESATPTSEAAHGQEQASTEASA